MKHIDEYRDRRLAGALAAKIRQVSSREAGFMEFCGGHTVTIARYGIESLLPGHLRLLSGPGCPVCVTPIGLIDLLIAIAAQPGVMVTTYGDMLRVPGTRTSLIFERGRGADVRVVYSSYDALELARENPSREIVFFGIGFETTAPSTAAAVLKAQQEDIGNFSVLSAHKTTPGIIRALLDSDQVRISGLICPGHVSVVTGVEPYLYAAGQRGVPCVISGFEPLDMLQTILMLVLQVEQRRSEVEIQYRRSVRPDGNPKARQIMCEVFEPVDSDWRGLGVVKGTGLDLRPGFDPWNARKKFNLPAPESVEPEGCICGKILRGAATPADCALFAGKCTPDCPVGACMVSSEGACQAFYKWRRRETLR